MAATTFTCRRSDLWPIGTSVKAFSGLERDDASRLAIITPITSATVAADGSLVLSGLTSATPYLAFAAGRTLRFVTDLV